MNQHTYETRMAGTRDAAGRFGLPDGGGILRGLLCSVLFMLSIAHLVHAAPGDLDPSFGTGGRVTTDFSGRSGFDLAYAVAIQPDGKIVVAGDTLGRVGTHDFALVRYHPDGTPDTDFGDNAKVTTDFDESFDIAYAVAIQPDGKIVVAGFADVQGDFGDFAVARYHPDGTRDRTFGGDGKVTTNFQKGGGEDRAFAMALQPDGKIVLAGEALTGPNQSSGERNFALARYNTDGTLDRTFGGDGKVTTDFGNGLEDESIRALTLQPDGKIVVAGYSTVSGTFDFALARYHANGRLDTMFGDGGRVTTDFGGIFSDIVFDIALQPDGKIVVAGTPDATGFALARYRSNGRLDPTFGDNGKVITKFKPGTFNLFDQAFALVLQPDGKIVAAGVTNVNDAADFALARYRTNGRLDTTFGHGGRVTTRFNGGAESIRAIALQADGKIVVTGNAFTGSNDDFALARYRTFFCDGLDVTILGDDKDNILNGTAGADVIQGLGGNDTIRGFGGNDVLCGGPGNDMLRGNDGNDRLFGQGGTMCCRGEAGRTTVRT